MTGTRPHRHPHPSPPPDARTARLAVCALFALLGIVSGVWAARIPAIKQTLALSDGQLTYGLLAIALGLITGMRFAGRLTDRAGSARVAVPAAAGVAITLIAPGYAPNLPLLITALYLWGTLNASLDVAMNTHAVEVERAYGRPLMSSFHAMFSLGALLGAAAGALAAHLAISPGATFTLTAVPLTALALAVRPRLLPRTPPPANPTSTTPPRRRAPWNRWIVLVGLVAFAGLVGEGAVIDWSAVYLREHLHTSPAAAAFGFAAFSTAMTAGRLGGDMLARRLGPVRLVRWSGITAAAGLTTGLLSGHPAAAIAGFTLFGLGLSTIVPQAFSAAGNHDPAHPGEAIAQVATLGYTGLVLGPAIIGGAAELAGLPMALAIPAALAAFMAAAATALRPRRTGPG